MPRLRMLLPLALACAAACATPSIVTGAPRGADPSVLPASSRTAPLKPRIIVLTDISPNNVEPDDMESLIRLLVHADLFEIEGLVATTGWSNGGGQERRDLIQAAINAYEKDLPNLRKRSNQAGHRADESQQQIGYWPSAAYLRVPTHRMSPSRAASPAVQQSRSLPTLQVRASISSVK